MRKWRKKVGASMEEKKDDECVINKFVVGCLICYRKNKRTNDERERKRERSCIQTLVSGLGKVWNPKEMKLHYILNSTSNSPYL